MFDNFIAFLQGVPWLFAVLVIVALGVVAVLVYRAGYRVVKANEVLVVTGGKRGPRIIRSGGAYVSMFRKSEVFPLSNMTIRSEDNQSQTSTKVPVVVKWTAQIRPDTSDAAALQKAIIGYIGNDREAIENSLKQTLDGEIRQVIATLTPDQVITDQQQFNAQVTSNVSPKMSSLGFELVSLNIAEVSDRNGHYENLAAADREAKRQEAETLTANADQEVAVARAKATQISESADLDKQLVVAEKSRDNALKQAGFDQEVATAQGQVTVTKANQQKAAATANQEVAVTEAETARKTVEIQATSTARKNEIDAEVAAKVTKTNATAKADALAIEAKGESDAIAVKTQAQAEQVRQSGQAEADAARARGEAEAAAILAKGQSEAEVQRLMAEALTAGDGANLKVTLAEIQRDTQITVYTEVGKAMASVGEKATIIDMGGNSGDGDLLTSLMGRVPELMKKLDVQSGALQGVPFGASVAALLAGDKGDAAPAPAAPVKPAATPVEPVSPEKPAAAPAVAPVAPVKTAAAKAPVATPAPVVPAASAEVTAGSVKLEVPLDDDSVVEPSGSDGFTADDAVGVLQAAADAAPGIVENARAIRDAVKPLKPGKSTRK